MAENKDFYTKISLSDHRLSKGERRFLEQIATKLSEPTRGGPLPEGHARAIEEASGDDCGGWRDRWQPPEQ